MGVSGNGMNLNPELEKFPEGGPNRYESLSIDKIRPGGEVRGTVLKRGT